MQNGRVDAQICVLAAGGSAPSLLFVDIACGRQESQDAVQVSTLRSHLSMQWDTPYLVLPDACDLSLEWCQLGIIDVDDYPSHAAWLSWLGLCE
jgi:hypothetical protein